MKGNRFLVKKRQNMNSKLREAALKLYIRLSKI